MKEKLLDLQKNRDNVYDRNFFLLADESFYMSHNHNTHIYLKDDCQFSIFAVPMDSAVAVGEKSVVFYFRDDTAVLVAHGIAFFQQVVLRIAHGHHAQQGECCYDSLSHRVGIMLCFEKAPEWP